MPIFDEEQPPPPPQSNVDDEDEDDLQKSLTGSFINYATFRQNISNDAAIAAQKRAMITAKIAKHWSNDDLPNLQKLSKSESDNPEDDEDEDDDEEEEDSSEISDDLESHENSERIASPSPPTRSRSSSPGKTVTFLEQDERSLNELESSPRRVIDLRPLTSAASSLFGGHKKPKGQKKKRLAPSPPLSKSLAEDEEAIAQDENKNHKSLEARLSASLRATFARNSQS